MKSTAFLLISLAVTCLSFRTAVNQKRASIVGKWTADSKEVFIEYSFASNGKYEITTRDKTQKSDKSMEMRYTFDNTKSPAWIDLEIINKKDAKMSLTIPGIIQLMDANSFKMNLGGINGRPSDFSGENVTIFNRTPKR